MGGEDSESALANQQKKKINIWRFVIFMGRHLSQCSIQSYTSMAVYEIPTYLQ